METPDIDIGRTVERLRRRAAYYRDLTFLDDLTGALNERAFRRDYSMRAKRLREASEGFAVAYGDLDRFGRFNKRYGQPAGNSALMAFVRESRRRLRPTDRIYRLHGDEFAFLIAVGNRETLDGIVRRLEGAVEVKLFGRKKPEQLTATIAGLVARRRGLDTLLLSIDRRLRGAKRQDGAVKIPVLQ